MIGIYSSSTRSGVYAICIDGHIAYVGQSADLWSRAASHYYNILHNDTLWYPLAREFHERGHYISMKILATPPEKDLLKIEKEYILKLKPLFNSQHRETQEYKTLDYGAAVDKLFLGYRPPVAKTPIQKQQPEEAWFGDKITIRRW